MAATVRFGIVGLGMGRGRAQIVKDTPGAELVAVCDIWEERGRQAQQELGCEWIRDYDEMLKRDDIDVIGVWTPSGMHCDFAVRALQAGKHVCMTKPMDIHVAACDAAIEAAEKAGLVLAVDFESRYSPINHQIRSALQSGAIGKVIAAVLLMRWFRGQNYYDSGMPQGWRSRLETEGGSLANQAVHYLDLLQWWLGPVEWVFGRKGTYGHNIETEDACVCMLKFASGAMATLLTTTCSFPDLGTEIAITGTTGTVAWKDGKITVFEAAKSTAEFGADQAQYVRPEFAEAPDSVQLDPGDFAVPADLPGNIIEDMLGAVTQGKPVQCDGYEGRKTVQIIEAVYKSSDTGQPVAIS